MDPDDPFFDDDSAVPLKHFDVYDFFEDPSEKKLTILLGMAICAMIETYDYPITFLCYLSCYFSMLFSFPYYFSIQLSIMRPLIFYLNFVFILKIYGSLLQIDQLYAICW